MLRIAVDTNILAYAEGLGGSPADDPKIAASRTFLRRARATGPRLLVPLQALAELHSVLARKARLTPDEAAARVAQVMTWSECIAIEESVFRGALELAGRHRLRIFDAIILSAAASAGAGILLSEDLSDGFVWRGVTVADPFAAIPVPRLAQLLG